MSAGKLYYILLDCLSTHFIGPFPLYIVVSGNDHLKMAVAISDAHHPNILSIETCTRISACQEHKKRPLLERIAQCSRAQIVPSIDSLSAPKTNVRFGRTHWDVL